MTQLTLGCLGLGLAYAGLALLLAVFLPRTPKLATLLPRAQAPGVVLTLGMMLWLSQAAIEMIGIPEASGWRTLLWLAAPVLTLLFATTLDFLPSRAIGGLLLLSATLLVDAGFAQERMPFRPLFSAGCYLSAVPGFILVVVPWRLRDLLQWSLAAPSRRPLLAGGAGGAALFFIGYAIAIRVTA